MCTSVTSVLRPADVKDIVDDMRKPTPYCSECLVTKIKKNKNIVENIWKGYDMSHLGDCKT